MVGELSKPQKELIDIQSKSLQKLHALIDELLRQHERNYAVVSDYCHDIRVDSLIRNILKEHNYSIGASRINLSLKLEKCRISGNTEQFRALLDNVIVNAIRFSPEDGELAVELFRENDNMVIVITDQGPGIPEAERKRVFEAFYQGRQQPDRVVKGSGLGLAIAREYAAAHGGTIDIVSSESGGACFRIVLPAHGSRGQPGQQHEVTDSSERSGFRLWI